MGRKKCVPAGVCQRCGELRGLFDACRAEEGLLTVSRLARVSGVPRKKLIELYSQGESVLVLQALASCEEAAIKLLAAKDTARAGEFILKNDFGWADKPEQADEWGGLAEGQSDWAR